MTRISSLNSFILFSTKNMLRVSVRSFDNPVSFWAEVRLWIGLIRLYVIIYLLLSFESLGEGFLLFLYWLQIADSSFAQEYVIDSKFKT